ncbi:hypothetical protein [Streptomyces chryseus]
MTPQDATALLAEFRAETGAELTAGLRAHAKQEHQTQPNDTFAAARKRKVRFGAMQRAADWIAQATASGRLTTLPNPRNRSTS